MALFSWKHEGRERSLQRERDQPTIETAMKYSSVAGWGVFDSNGMLISLMCGRGEQMPVLSDEAIEMGYNLDPLFRPVI